MNRKLLLPLLALAALALPARAITDQELRAIVPNGFSRASVMTVNGYNGSAPLENFPVLVKIAANSPTGFQYSDLNFPSTGDDLGFVDMEGNGLPFEIDEWNPSGTSVLWVKLPSVANGTNFVMVYRSAHTGKSLNVANPFADYVGVWHLGETATGSTTIYDSTDNDLDGTSHSRSSPFAEGAIGGGRRINTSDNDSGATLGIQVPLGATDSAKRVLVDDLVPEFTASFWWRHPTINTRWNQIIGRKGSTSDPAWHLVFEKQSNEYTPLRVYTQGTDGNSHYVKATNPQTSRETWYKVDLVFTVEAATRKGRYKLYWNGSSSNPSEGYTYGNKPAGNGTGDFYIGGSGGSRPYTGWMDEVRLRKFIATPDWVKAEYDQATSSTFLSKAEVVEFVELPKPVISATRGDFGAAFVQFSGSVSQLGGAATSCDVYAKVWPVGGNEPATGTLLASGLVKDSTFTDATVTGLTPQLEYQWEVYAVNNLEPTAYESDPVSGPTFTTAGVGGAGTGGVVSRVVDDYIHVFEISIDGTATYEFTPPAGVTSVEALVVGGGGPGGFYAGGGGGAGGLVHDTALALSGGTTYTVAVGDGGVPADTVDEYGTNGGDSLITSNGGGTTNAIAFGGGAGGNGPLTSNQTATNEGKSGGSGGGSTRYTAAAGAGTTGQGCAGAVGLYGFTSDSKQESGGGGGAGGTGSPGSKGSTQFPGAGGNGIELDITGTKTYYAGGGSGGGEEFNNNGSRGYPVSGGLGGGGRGGMKSNIAGDEVPTAGEDGLGGGGGGGSTVQGYTRGGAGGSGIVVIRYPATGNGVGATEPMVSLTGLDYDAQNNVASLAYRVAWAGAGYQTADVSAIWGFSEDALVNEVSLSQDLIGHGSGSITTLPSVSRTVYVKVKATNAGNASGVSTETKTIALYNPRAPEATIANTSVSVSGGAFSVNVTSLGQGADSAVISLQACANRAFAAGVVTNANLATITATGASTVNATGLTDSSTWWVRAVVSNNIAQVYETDPVSITTLTPGYPNGNGSVSDFGFTSVSALTRATLIGLGSTEVTRWLEASEDESFTTLVGTPTRITATRINLDGTSLLTGLEPGTAYHLRLALSNDWNRVAYTRLTDFITRAEPFAATGPAWTAGDGTFDFSLAIGGVYDGADCSATLTYGENEIGTIAFDDASDVVAWPSVPAAADGAVAQIVVTATLPDEGGTFTKTFSAPIATGSSGTGVASIDSYCSAESALRMHPGDSVALPTLFGDASYQVLNERFATLDGNVLTALEPGIVGIRCVNASLVTNVMGVVILPDSIGSGSIYIFKETKRNNSYDWARSACWEKVGSASNDSFPQNPDDIAILPFYTVTGDVYVRHLSDISIGGLFAGQIRPDTSVNCHLERYKYTDASNQTEATAPWTVTFVRTDGKPVDVKTCPNSEGDNYSRIVLAGYDIDVVWASDAVIDGCSSEADVNGPRGRFYVKTGGSTNTLQGVTLTFRGYPGYARSDANCTDVLKGVWKGTGTIIKEGPGGIAFDGDFSGFSGTIYELSGPNLDNFSNAAAGILMRAAGASNVTAHIYGWGSYNSSTGVPQHNGRNRGILGTGGAGVGPAGGAQGPAKGLYMHGGTFRANNIDNGNWGKGVKDEKAFDILSVGPGYNYVTLVNGAGNGSGKPINAVTAKTLGQTDKGTLVVYDPSLNNKAVQSTTNAMFTVQNWADLAIGGTGYGEQDAAGAADNFTIIPWMVANGDSDFGYLVFPAIDANGRLVRPVRKTTYISTASGTDANAVCPNNYGSLTRGDATEIVVNSLFLNNASNGDKWLGADRTLRITSGGLILHENGSAIGLPGRDDNGALVLGDATRPAYVWSKAYGNYTNRIWATVSAPGGFVSCYTGNLELGGDQTGISDEIVVNGGTLALGNAEYGIELANGLPIRVCAGAKLILPKSGAVANSPLKIDGSAGAFGKVELAASQTVASVAVRDVYESETWTTLPAGTYGSSASSAEFVRDDLFVGPGTLRIGAAAPVTDVMLLIW